MIRKKFRYIIFNKPYNVLCQFTDTAGRRTIADYGPFESDIYPVGRLDADSEGLVLLSNDGILKHCLLEPEFHHPRTYLVQVERIPSLAALERLRKGIIIESKKTLPAKVEDLADPPPLWDRGVPIRFRKNVPTRWLKITIYEGRNRQVRKMTAAVGHPALRLVRISIATVNIGALQPGESRKLTDAEVGRLLAWIDRRGQ